MGGGVGTIDVKIIAVCVCNNWESTYFEVINNVPKVVKVGTVLGYEIVPRGTGVEELELSGKKVSFSRSNPIIVGEQTLRTLNRHGVVRLYDDTIYRQKTDNFSLHNAFGAYGASVIEAELRRNGLCPKEAVAKMKNDSYTALRQSLPSTKHKIVGIFKGSDGRADIVRLVEPIYGCIKPRKVVAYNQKW